MQDSMDNAYKGMAPKSDANLPQFLTMDKVLDILKDMYAVSAKVTQKRLDALRREGVEFNPYDARFIEATQTMEAEVEEKK